MCGDKNGGQILGATGETIKISFIHANRFATDSGGKRFGEFEAAGA